MRAYYFLGRLLRPFMIVLMYIYSYIFHTQRARIVLKSEHEEILLVLSWLSGDKWGFPGGGVGRNEDAVSAAVREVEEEVGEEETEEEEEVKPKRTRKAVAATQ